MACGVAVKRSLELDSLLSPESSLKRRRTSINATGHCAPFRPSFSNSPPHHHHHQSNQQQNQFQNSDIQQSSSSSAALNNQQNPSAFVGVQQQLQQQNAHPPKISSDELESFLMSEIQAIRRRRYLPNPQGGDNHHGGEMYGGDRSDSDSEQTMDTHGHGQQSMMASSPYRAQHSSASSSPMRASMSPSNLTQSERPLFTFKQVRLICERLLKEQEGRLREEYDQVLNARLAEQYDTFVRFTYDQIHRRIDDSPMSYLS